MGYRIVVAGATGNVGREVLAILAEREFPIAELAVVASSRSQGEPIEIGDTGRTLKCQNIENFDWTGWDMAIRSEEHTSELQSLMRISYAVFCLKKKKHRQEHNKEQTHDTTM